MLNNKPQGNLPSNTVVNPKENCQAILLRNGKQVEQPSVQKSVVQNEELGEKSDTKANGVTEDHQEVFKKLHINIPFAEALEQMPSYVKFMKEILSKKRKLEDYETVALTEERLGLGEASPTTVTLQLADRSVKHPRGIIDDVLVKVDKFIFPADFIVLDMEEDMDVPIILGRPFLATGQALIDVQKGELTLRVQGEEVVFNVFKAVKFANVNDSYFKVDMVEKAVAEINLTEDSLQKSLTIGDIDADLDSEVQECVQWMNSKGPIYQRKYEDLGQGPERPLPSVQKPPELELKSLPAHLRYAFLGEKETLPVIVSSSLSNEEMEKLFRVLRTHKLAIGWTLADIQGISPSTVMHKILMEDDSKPSIEAQRRLNPAMKEVVRKEILKWLDAGVIYPISDSSWVSPVQVVPKKGGITVVKNDNNELIPTRTVTGWRICIDYRKLNKATRKDHFPLPFLDQMILKQKLVSAPIVISPDWDQPFELMCDASDFAVGAVLGQHVDKVFRTIYYASRTLNGAQLNYATTEKELLAIVYAFDKFRPYLMGNKVIVYTDHSAIRHLIAKKDAKPRLIRWVLLLQEFDMEVRDKKGTENLVTDHLSRLELGDKSELAAGEINESFPDEQLFAVEDELVPWFADYVNYLAANIVPPEFVGQRLKKFYHDVKNYYWDDPFLFKQCPDLIIRRCVPEREMKDILFHFHASPTGGHFGGARTVAKVLECGFYWPTLYKDSYDYVKRCDCC
ncbi:uncharacterized protein LOC133823987 [Humulus lupulus]|uniref:uncharacterized protein LOC133823987 n=1 Tax=Humulus lupulus TaxID=3486 RepID=UPI002B4051F9|nr:uncharacterized protein LOC133823987 [Humulus lupulus]